MTDKLDRRHSGRPAELTVCDIIGEWGLYHWSITMFAIIYSALFGVTAVVGPIWTPDLAHLCLAPDEQWPADGTGLVWADQRECSRVVNTTRVACTRFVYDDQAYGSVLTNSVSSN